MATRKKKAAATIQPYTFTVDGFISSVESLNTDKDTGVTKPSGYCSQGTNTVSLALPELDVIHTGDIALGFLNSRVKSALTPDRGLFAVKIGNYDKLATGIVKAVKKQKATGQNVDLSMFSAEQLANIPVDQLVAISNAMNGIK